MTDPLTPPLHSLEAEQAVLGGVMLDALRFDDAADVLVGDDFYRADHRTIWCALCALQTDRQPLDVLTVSEWLQARGELDAGGLQYLATMARDTPSAANVSAYAQIVRDRSVRRQMLAAAQRIGTLAAEASDTPAALGEAQAMLLALSETSAAATRGPVLAREALRSYIEELDARHERGGAIAGEATGLEDLDRAVNGLEPGRLYVVAGRPAMGKSVLGLQIAASFAVRGLSTLVFSAEMPTAECLGRLVSSLGQIDHGRVQSARLEDADWGRLTTACVRLSEAALAFDDSESLTITELRARARRHKRQHGLALVVVDHLGLLRGEGRTENRTQEVGTISRGLKRMAKELHIPVIALCQLNRGLEARADKRPLMADLRESGDIEQDADVVAMLYRDEVYNPGSPDKGCAELLLRKVRGGIPQMIPLRFDGCYQRFRPLSGRLPSHEAPDDFDPTPRNGRGFRGSRGFAG